MGPSQGMRCRQRNVLKVPFEHGSYGNLLVIILCFFDRQILAAYTRRQPRRRGENKHFALAKKHDRTLSTCILTATDWNNSKVLLLGLNYINNQSINQKERKVERKERRRGKRPIIVTGKVSILGQKVQEEESLPRGTNHL